ncbi:MAG: UDP-N-acetylglucosamine 1-carboxyvinyltransferase [Syntrophales bacterium]|jgi:UDP-N-acetylglucosamine 1-carboxyvinyltransferase|nr:UDP-N-acetylglucosamine 1-carboxyvinyltransferase [Syntrophales bacterium]
MIIEGGERLQGVVEVSGAKNAALPILVSSLLAEGPCTFHNVPELMDIRTANRLLRGFGAEVEGTGTVRIDARHINHVEAPYELVKTMRASVLVLGPLVARMGRARVSLPGGCAIGARPVNLHIRALEEMGATVTLQDGYIEATAPRLRGATIYFDIQTVTGTENIMMAACLADGTTVLKNAAKEPEIVNLADVLTAMGARITGAGTETITIGGVTRLTGAEGTVMPDRIECGTYMIGAAITGGDVTIRGCDPRYVDALIVKLVDAGILVEPVSNGVRVRGGDGIRSIDIKTAPYPGFPTDLQAQMMVLLSIGNGLSVVTETVFENRFMHVAELVRMGANIVIQGGAAIVQGVPVLKGAPVMATDLRASACLVLAGLVAEGRTDLSRIYHLDRGYQRMEEKFSALGARIRRESA